MTIHLATDHAGFAHKEALKKYLAEKGYMVKDHGAYTLDVGDDYPDFVLPCAEAVAATEGDMGVIFGGSGEGEQMAANKIAGIRAAEYYGGEKGAEILKLSREHNDANILSIGARFVSIEESISAVQLWLDIPFSNDPRHEHRIEKF